MLGQLDSFIAFAVVILGVSLLITVLNQAVVAILALRGTNLRWGIETLLAQVDPNLAAHSKKISRAVLEHPLISDASWSPVARWPVVGPWLTHWKLASAIRVEELLTILEKLATTPEPNAWQKALKASLDADNTLARKRLDAATEALAKLPKEAQANLDTVAPHVALQMRKAAGDIQLWFDAVMDRVSQRFADSMRVWTIVFSVIVAFALHLDASQILRDIQADPALRARLLASTDAMTRQAERVLDSAVPSAPDNALKRLQAESDDLKDLDAAPQIVSRAGAREWIVQRKLPPEKQAALLERLDVLVRDETKNVLEGLGRTASEIRGELLTAGLHIIPDYSKHQRRRDAWPDWWIFTEPTADNEPTRWNEHFLGVLFSAVLLSLGAPFWFSVLKSAAALRPVLASKETTEREKRG